VTSRRVITLEPRVSRHAFAQRSVRLYAGLETGPERVPVRVSSREGALLVEFHLPGVSTEEMLIEVSGELLTVEAVRAPTSPDVQEIASDVTTGRLRREIRLPVQTDAESSSARYEDGVLLITLPIVPPGETTAARRPEGPPVGEPEDDPGDDLPP
jgi:HSP20 family molecular chaperone IbpA